jgi:hypothetical protein
MGPVMSAELSRLHQLDVLREAERDRLVAQARAARAPLQLPMDAPARRGLLQLRNAVLSSYELGVRACELLGGVVGAGDA